MIREKDIQFWDNCDGTWLVNCYTEYAKGKLKAATGEYSIVVSDLEIFKVYMWAKAQKMRVDTSLDLKVKNLSYKS